MLYQLSYTHQKNPVMLRKPPLRVKLKMARQEGFEPSAYGLEVRCSIQLSYWRNTRERAVKIETTTGGCVSSTRYKDLQTKISLRMPSILIIQPFRQWGIITERVGINMTRLHHKIYGALQQIKLQTKPGIIGERILMRGCRMSIYGK